MNCTQAIEALKNGDTLIDKDNLIWRLNNGAFECRAPSFDMHDWQPFGRAPLPDDAPFRRLED